MRKICSRRCSRSWCESCRNSITIPGAARFGPGCERLSPTSVKPSGVRVTPIRRPPEAATPCADFKLADPQSELSQLWNQEHDRHVAQRLLQLVEGDFTPTTWQAFRRVVIDGVRASQAARELGLSVNAVLIAKRAAALEKEGRGLIN